MRKKRILVIDDEPSMTQLLKLSLEYNGAYTVRCENDGHQARQAAMEFNPDLVLLDVCLSDTDGGKVASHFQSDANLKHIPIVFVTGLVSAAEESHGLRGGFEFIAKPFHMDKVIACIERTLEGQS